MRDPLVPFGLAVEDVTRGNPKLPNSAFQPSGAFPVVDQGQSLVSGYSDDESLLCKVAGPVIVFGDHTRTLKYVDFPFVIGADGVKVLRVFPGWYPKYVYHFLKARDIASAGYSRHFKFLRELQIPKPELDVQRDVAARLDLATALAKKRRQTITHLQDLAESVFIEMFGNEGRRAVTSRADLMHTRGWEWRRLTEVAQLATGHTPNRKRPEYWNGGIPWISLPEIRALDGEVAIDTELKISQAGIDNSSAVMLPKETVCFSRTASIGFVTKLARPMATSQDFHNWIPGPGLNSDYLMAALRVSRPHLLGSSDGSTHKTIYQRVALEFRVLLPPLAMQESFAARMQKRVEVLALASAAREDLDACVASLVSRTFEGAL